MSMVSSLRKIKGKAGLWLSRPFSPEADRHFVWLTMGLFVVLWLWHVWLGDDAAMTFRQILNFTEGHGIVWNWGERIQFTSPLWHAVLSISHVLSGGLFEANILKYSFLFVSLSLCLGALWLFFLGLKDLQKGVVVVFFLCLLSSQAFIDYTSSGLENPLSYFLVALIAYRFFSDRYDGFFFFLCALLFLTRMDYALLLLPLCFYAWRSCGYKISVVFFASSLCLLWLVFATWYFGHPLPSTFLTKTNIDASLMIFVKQGLFYYARTLTQDPVTLFVMFCVVVACCYDVLRRRRLNRLTAVVGGVVLYGLYMLWIGGDFMQGRFFSVPFVMSLFCGSLFLKKTNFHMEFLRFPHHRQFISMILLLMVMMSCVSIAQRFKESFVLEKSLRYRKYHGVVNERRFETAGGIRGWGVDFQSFQDSAPSLVRLECCPGAIGLASDGSEYILDNISLASPYLCRIPASWSRVGHAGRHLPTDMEAWVVGVIDALPDPHANAFFSDIRHVVRGDLFSWNRMKKIVKINLSDNKIDDSSKDYKNQPRFSRFHPSFQQKMSLGDLPSIDKKTWDSNGVRWNSYNITQSISIPLERGDIRKVSFPVSEITEYSWSLYDGSTKIYENSYTTDKRYSYHTFILSKTMTADRLEIIVKKGGVFRRIARPILE